MWNINDKAVCILQSRCGEFIMVKWSRLFCHRVWWKVDHWWQNLGKRKKRTEGKLFLLFLLSQVLWAYLWNPIKKNELLIRNWLYMTSGMKHFFFLQNIYFLLSYLKLLTKFPTNMRTYMAKRSINMKTNVCQHEQKYARPKI